MRNGCFFTNNSRSVPITDTNRPFPRKTLSNPASDKNFSSSAAYTQDSVSRKGADLYLVPAFSYSCSCRSGERIGSAVDLAQAVRTDRKRPQPADSRSDHMEPACRHGGAAGRSAASCQRLVSAEERPKRRSAACIRILAECHRRGR